MNVFIVEYNFSLPRNTLVSISLTKSSKIVNYILKILQSSNYRFTLFGSCLSAKAYHIGGCNLDFLEISHFLITPMLPIITFWKRDFHLVLVMRDILSTWKIEIFPRIEQTQFFSQRGSKRCVYIWLGERCCLVFMNR